VKKLMAEHFDAVVVDCDNEQNATLLFKSARNTTGNQSSLAVAVVEGQAGVAKAFRIGANLVLTKPINVDQAKGTLRVARGLLRKGETAKQGVSAQTGSKPTVRPGTPAVAAESATPPLVPFIPAATGILTQKLVPQVSATEINRSAESAPPVAASQEVASPALSVEPMPLVAAPKSVSITNVEPKPEPVSRASSSGFGAGSASAPAPAREKTQITEDKPAKTTAPEISTTVEAGVISPTVESSAATPVASPDAAVSKTKASGGNKTALIGVAAVLLIAAGGYEAWLQWGRSNPAANAPAVSATQVAKAPVTPASPVTSVKSPTSSAQPTGVAKVASTPETSSDSQSTATHQNKARASDSIKPALTAPVESKTSSEKASAKPIMIKSGDTGSYASNAAPVVSMSGIADSGNEAELPSLMGSSKAPTPVLQTLTVSQGVSQGLLVKEVQPIYPANAMRMHVEGGVQLLATVSKAGSISAIKIISGDSQLAKAAADAVKQWKYKPYLLNGSPVEIQTQITVNFKLPR
jgi:TonB family protein